MKSTRDWTQSPGFWMMPVRGSSALSYDAYPSEIRNRQRIEELRREIGKALSDETAERLKSVDATLHSITEPNEFIWSASLQSTYPQEDYWYLYALPHSPEV